MQSLHTPAPTEMFLNKSIIDISVPPEKINLKVKFLFGLVT
jgi:hypothetical protein